MGTKPHKNVALCIYSLINVYVLELYNFPLCTFGLRDQLFDCLVMFDARCLAIWQLVAINYVLFLFLV